MITGPSPNGRWKARRSPRANSSASTPSATSRIDASTKPQRLEGDQRVLDLVGAAARDDEAGLLVPGQEHRDDQPERGDRREPLLGVELAPAPRTRGTGRRADGAHAARAHAGAPAGARMRSSSRSRSAAEIVRSWPWKASVQCSAGHLRTCSSSPRSSRGRDPVVARRARARARVESATGRDRACRACPARAARGPRTSRPSAAPIRRTRRPSSGRRRSGRRAPSRAPEAGGAPSSR